MVSAVIRRASSARPYAGWARTVAAVTGAYLIVSNGFFFFAGAPQIAAFLGAVTGMLAPGIRSATIIAALVPVLLELLAPPFLAFDRPVSLTLLVQTVLLAAGIAYGVQELRGRWPARDPQIVRALAAVLVAMLVLNLWIPLVVAGTHPLVGYGPLPASALRAAPVAGQYVTDDELYRRFFYLLHEGRGHYEAFRDAWLGLRLRGELPASVSSYRLPTYYWIWKALPADAFLIEVVFLAFASVGAVAAACIAGELAGAAVAPLAAAAVLAYAMSIAISVYVTYVDFPAGCVVLVAVFLWVSARRRGSTRLAWLAVAMFVLAALMREILVYMLLVAAASAWLEPRGERRRAVLPWVAGLGAFTVAYAVHAWNVVARIPGRTGHLDYSQGSTAFAIKAVTLFAEVFSGTSRLLALLFVAGVAAAWYAGRRVSIGFAAFALAVLLAPLAGMLWLGNPGLGLNGGIVNYWGQLFVPLALALWPTLLGKPVVVPR